MHENYAINLECEISTTGWTKFKTFEFNKSRYVLKFIQVEFGDGCDGDVELKIENNKGKLLPWATGGSDVGITGITAHPLKFYIGVPIDKHDEFDIFYKNDDSTNKHYVNVYFEFISVGNHKGGGHQ